MNPPRRFYRSVTIGPDFSILLDGRTVKTPRKAPLLLPHASLAQAVAREWEDQGEFLNLEGMVANKLANTAIDRIPPERPKVTTELVTYAGSDLVCYRATEPEKLVARQNAHWDPVLDWARLAFDAGFAAVPGIVHRVQPAQALRAFEAQVSGLNDFELAALFAATTLTGSALIAFMVQRGAMGAEAAWLAAHVDEDHQIEEWGLDEEASDRRNVRHGEFAAICNFMALCR